MGIGMDDIEEVLEVGPRACNFLLQHRHRLLEVGTIHRWKTVKEAPEKPGKQLLRRGLIYVVGRPKGVPSVIIPDLTPTEKAKV